VSEKKLIDATELCRYLLNWQLSCAGNVTGGKNARDNLVIYNTIDKVMEVIENATAEEQRVYNLRVDKDKLDAMQKVLTQQIHLIAMETQSEKKWPWHDAKNDAPCIEEDGYYAGPFLVTDGCCEPYKAYYVKTWFGDVRVMNWQRGTARGEEAKILGPEQVKYWMDWPTPPKEEQHETD